jgi:hypothetical protein
VRGAWRAAARSASTEVLVVLGVPHLVDLAVVDKLLDEERALVLGKGFRKKGNAVIGELCGQPCPVCMTRTCTAAAVTWRARGRDGGRGFRARGGGPVAEPAHSPAGQQDTATMASGSHIDVNDFAPPPAAMDIPAPVP